MKLKTLNLEAPLIGIWMLGSGCGSLGHDLLR